MAPPEAHPLGENASPSQRRQFFKVLFPNPFANLRVPRKFHAHLPRKLPKLATLSSIGGRIWNVEVHQDNQDIFFRSGWSEFAKAHDLHTGYFLVFRHEGNMVFSVTIFDRTCCLKEYAPPFVQLTPHDIEINDIFGASDETLSVKAHDVKMEISSDSLTRRKKLSTGKAQRVVEKEKGSTSQRTMRRRKTVKISSKQTLSEKSEDESKATTNSLGIKRKANGKGKEEFRKEKKPTVQKKERKKIVKIIHNSTDYRQFQKILSPATFKHREVGIPKQFFVKNRLVGKRIFFLKRKRYGKSWPVHILSREYGGRICKGWREFAEENGLKAGDHITFKLLSEDTLLVNMIDPCSQRPTSNFRVMPKASKGESRFKIKQKRIVDKKQKPFKESTEQSETSTIVKHYHLKLNYIYISNIFCVKNKLTSGRDVVLKDLEGREWLVNFYYREQEGRFNRDGWRKFSTEKRLKEGDKCIFKLIEKDTVLVHVIKSEQV